VAKLRVTYNAPVVLTFGLLALVALLLQQASDSMRLWFMAWPHLGDTRSYVGLFSHVLGHQGWDHLTGNFMFILLLGPILEERHGSRQLLAMILITALVTGVAVILFGSGPVQGASGIVFMMILLASMANIRGGDIPLTFIVVAVIFLGGEVIQSFKHDQISHMAHLVGGLAGGMFGFLAAKPKQAKPVDLKKLKLPIATKPAYEKSSKV
jgi:membrane associated rhomboid family serine protease